MRIWGRWSSIAETFLPWPWWEAGLPPQLCGLQPLPPPQGTFTVVPAWLLLYWCVLLALEGAEPVPASFCLPVAAYIKMACVSLPHMVTRFDFSVTSGHFYNTQCP